MFWKNLGLNKKIVLFTATLLTIVFAMSVIYIAKLNATADEVHRLGTANDLSAVMLRREIDHLLWVNTLQGFVFDENQKELTIQRDPKKCGFGIWYYGQGRAQAESVFPDLAAPLRDIEAYHNALHASAGEIVTLKAQGDGAAMREVFKTVAMPSMKGVQNIFGQLVTSLSRKTDDAAKKFNQTQRSAYNSTYIVLGVAVVLSLLLAVLIARSITSPILKIAAFAAKVADKNFSSTIDVDRHDEIGTLAGNLKTMVGNMIDMLKQAEGKTQEAEEQSRAAQKATREAEEAKLAAEHATVQGMHEAAARLEEIIIKTRLASESLLQSVHEATRGVDLQLRHTSETATAMVQMNASVSEVAKNAFDAASNAEKTRENAENGSSVVAETIAAIGEVRENAKTTSSAMEALKEQAQGVGRIMTVITDIADQTNLLALNAAIEAARAGDAGKGFAVVADEVRKLAEKTMEATREVGKVVSGIQNGTNDNLMAMQESTKRVNRSTELALSAGESLAAIVTIAEMTASQIHSIAAASEEQSAASEQISKNTEEVNRAAENNAALMREAAKTVEVLDALTRGIVDLIEELKNV